MPYRLCQGDILKDLQIFIASDYDIEKKEYIKSYINLKYSVVINQECDLNTDFKTRNATENKKADKLLSSILILPAFLLVDFKSGSHLGNEVICEHWNSEQMKQIKQNKYDRFYYLKSFEELQIPELIIDFKHLYTISTNLIYKKDRDKYHASISEIFRESLSQKYCNYLSRIGLPEIN